jgi:hypothetical protein
MTTFNDVLEKAESLSQDEREDLIHILQARLREERRNRLLEDVEAGRQEFAAGLCKPATVEEIMKQVAQ